MPFALGDFAVRADVGLAAWTAFVVAFVLVLAYLVAATARRRGERFWVWFLAAIVLTPLVAFVLLLLLTPRPRASVAPTELQPEGAWGVTTGPDALATDHTAELERLADLRDRGALTDDEFEAQKARVLRAARG